MSYGDSRSQGKGKGLRSLNSPSSERDRLHTVVKSTSGRGRVEGDKQKKVMRKPKGKGPKKSGIKRSLALIIFLVIIIICGLGFGYCSAVWNTLPSVDNAMKSDVSSQIFDSEGQLITTVHASENRLPVNIQQVPKNLQRAFIDTEDSRFYEHHGIDPRGILRAIYVNVMHKGITEGASTITQQLARNAFLTQDRTYKRKIAEALLAIKIERHYSKQEILQMYMNRVYFGQGAYGVQSASHTYFGKDVNQLNLAQSAMLAGLPQSPNYYSPFNNLKAAKARQAEVLNRMVSMGDITQAQADAAKNQDLGLLSKAERKEDKSIAPYFVDYVKQLVAEKYGDDALYKQGLKIYTTLNIKDQRAAEEAMTNLPNFYRDEKGLEQPQGALIAINPQNGYIVAMVGGRGTDSFNRATMAVRQPGSAFKPFVYLTALQQGLKPDYVLDDKKIDINGYKPVNFEHTYSGKMTMRYALQESVNVPAVELAQKVGMSEVLKNAKDLGISTLTSGDDNLAAAIGGLTHGVKPIDMAVAYAAFANGGYRVKPIAITKIVDANGNVMFEATPSRTKVIDSGDAYVLTSLLESVINSGTGGNANFGKTAAGKTGTTDNSKDAWFVGYTPSLVAAVWMGDDYGTHTLRGLTGGTVPAQIWREFMQSALSDMPNENFSAPLSDKADWAKLGYAAVKDDKKKDDKNKKDDKDKKDSKDKVEQGGTDDDGSAVDPQVKAVVDKAKALLSTGISGKSKSQE